MLRIIAYDIANNRRRTQVVRTLEGYGHRVQESVFECHLDTPTYNRLQQEIAQHINLEDDLVRYYSLCPKDVADIQTAGCGAITTDTQFYWI